VHRGARQAVSSVSETWRDWRKLPQHDPQAIADLSANGIGLLFVDPDSRMTSRPDLSRGFV
jgi:hypothetical protein